MTNSMSQDIYKGDIIDNLPLADKQALFRTRYKSSFWGDGLRPQEDGSIHAFAVYRFSIEPTDPEEIESLHGFITDAAAVGYEPLLNPVILPEGPSGTPIHHYSSVFFFFQGAPATNLLTSDGKTESLPALQEAFRSNHGGSYNRNGRTSSGGRYDHYHVHVEQTDEGIQHFANFMIGALSTGYGKAMDAITLPAIPMQKFGRKTTEIPVNQVMLYLEAA